MIAEWTEGDDSRSDSSLSFMAAEDLADIQQNLLSSPFLHESSILPTRDFVLIAMHAHIDASCPRRFLGVRVDTCAKRCSIIPECQYAAYCDFGLQPPLYLANGASVQGIGGRRTLIGTARIQIPFEHLHLVIVVHFFSYQTTFHHSSLCSIW